MNNLKSTLCLLIVLTFGYVSNSQELTNTSCPVTSDCECIETEDYIEEDTGSHYYIYCPRREERTLITSIRTREGIHIECLGKVSPFTLLREFYLNTTEKAVFFGSCHLPEGSFKSLIQSIGINDTEKFVFVKSPNIADSLTKEHLAGFENVKVLSLHSNGITRLPHDFLKGLTNLTSLDLSRNQISSLPDDFLQGLTNLTSLDLSENQITSLPDDFLKGLVNLNSLNLTENYIKLSKQFFSHVTKLDTLSLQITQLKETDDRSIFENFTKLKSLTLLLRDSNLSNKDFKGISNLEKLIIYFSSSFRYDEPSLPEGLVSDNSKLQEVYLLRRAGYVNAVSLPNNLLSNLTNLKKVVINDIQPGSIPESTFWYSSSIKEITIFGNYLQTLPQDLFRDQINLEKLSLRYNYLEHLPDKVFKNLANLKELHLVGNKLKNISSPGIFDGLSNLKLLDLGNNQLNHIDVRAFRPLIKLESIELNSNELSSLNEGFPCFFQSGIEVIHLHRNKFEKLGGNFEKFINESTKLKVLTLYKNPWVCDCSAMELINIIRVKWKQVKFSGWNHQEPKCASDNRPLRNITMSEICFPQVAPQSEEQWTKALATNHENEIFPLFLSFFLTIVFSFF